MTTSTITTTTTVVTTSEVAVLEKASEQLLISFNDTKAAIKELEAKKAELEAQIRELLGDAKKATIDGVVRVTISDRTRSGVNTELLKAAFPEAFEATQTSTTYSVLTTK